MIHTTKTCSVTRRNLTVNLWTETPASELADLGYRGCKRCGADRELAQASSTTPTAN
jgi:methylphosphotriester-DNA--protein-cysteine methyltransferase